MGFDLGEIIVDSPTGAYFPGQFVDGRLVFELQEVKKFRSIYLAVKGFCKVHWTTHKRRRRRGNDRPQYYIVYHDSYEEYINLKLYLVGGENTEEFLKPGKYDYPFKFQIPSTSPSSFEGVAGHVRYELKAAMDTPYAIDKEIDRNIRVLVPLDLNAIDCKDPATLELEQTFCCWCCTSGMTETVVKIPIRGYSPGQVIPVEVSCRNRSTVEIKHITFSITKHVSYRAESTPGRRTDPTTFLEMKKGPVPPHTDRSWQLEMDVPDVDIHNMDTCSFIDINHKFTVTVSPKGCHKSADDSCQIYFGTIPLLNSSNGPDQIQQTNMQSQAYPPPYASFPQPAINQSVANQSYEPNSPFPPNPYPSNSPYPTPNPQPVSPYPGNAPYPNNSPYPGNNAPYPNNPSPIPPKSSPYPTSSPDPPNDAPYPNDPLEDKPATGFGMPGQGSSPNVPLLPPGSVPYPIGPSSGRSSPYAPSAPATTPGTEQKKPFDDDHSNTPFNPAFMDDKKESTEDK